MMKIIALDIGDVWTGTAISDALGMFARPYETVESKNLIQFLTKLFKQEDIGTVVIGNPTTLRGTISEQTQKVLEQKESLEKLFPIVTWVLWDERLSSKRAQSLKPAKNKQEKQQSHSIAAAFILTTYLDYLRNSQQLSM